jgi:toxin YoeB
MIYEVIFVPAVEKTLKYIYRNEKSKNKKIESLLINLQIDPRSGIGKPERLKHYDKQEVWSRRIDKKNRMVYQIENNKIIILSVLEHY